MNILIHKSEDRAFIDHGWLKTRHSFSFASYYDLSKMGFGKLRVINDDIVEPGEGFGTHPHDNMEIITVPIIGALEHKDSTGNIGVIRENEVQIMSAGTGLTHSEYNHSKSELVNLLQIWIYPKQKNIKPRYDQRLFSKEHRINSLQLLVSPNIEDDCLWINQDAFLSRIYLEEKKEFDYSPFIDKNCLYIFVISGKIQIENDVFSDRDGIGIRDFSYVKMKSVKNAEILFIEIPE